MNRAGLMAVTIAAIALSACAAPAELDPYPGAAWSDAAGTGVPPDVLALYADDCPGRGSGGFLDVLWPLDDIPGIEKQMRRYVRDPENVMPTTRLLAPYDVASSLPRSARFTGYSTAELQLWVGADDDIYVYLVAGTRVEALPRAAEESVPCS